jgi:four helix bundle protein
MGYKFERLEVWQLALDYTDIIYALADRLPVREEFNLKRQMIRAVTSIALNIAEGSTGQSNAEQARFLSIAVRSLLETVACLHLIHRRGYLPDPVPLREAYRSSETLFAKLQAFRKQLTPRPAPLKWRHFRGIALECGQGDWQRLPLQCSISRIGTGCGRAEARPYHNMSTLESRPAPHVREDPAAYPDDAGLPF